VKTDDEYAPLVETRVTFKVLSRAAALYRELG